LARAAGPEDLVAAVSRLRSRRGYESHVHHGSFADPAMVLEALTRTRLSITQAFLLPFAADADLPAADVPIEPVIVQKLRSVPAGSSLHFLLVDAVRRQYKSAAQ